MADLTITQVPLSELEPHTSNPRRGNVDTIAESLMKNGQYKPIVAARGVIIAGNHTFHAASTLGWDTVAVVELDIDPEGPEAMRIMLADNRTSDLGFYDDSDLLDVLERLAADGDLSGTGYLDDDLTDLRHLTDVHDITAGSADSGYDGAALDADGVIPDKGFATLAQDYAAKAVRSIVLPYGLEDYETVTRLLAKAREDTATESNADCIKALLLGRE